VQGDHLRWRKLQEEKNERRQTERSDRRIFEEVHRRSESQPDSSQQNSTDLYEIDIDVFHERTK
jgi:hypothetical protein